jgi:hypothetical protein
MGRRNPVHIVGRRIGQEYTAVPNDLIRRGVAELGLDAYAVLLLLMSHKEGYETSAVDLSARLGLGKNQTRAAKALTRLASARRLVIQPHRQAFAAANSWVAYVVRADGDRFTDEEIEKWSQAVLVVGRSSTKTVEVRHGE